MYGKHSNPKTLPNDALVAELIRTVHYISGNRYEPDPSDPAVHQEWRESFAYQKKLEKLILERMK